MPDLPLQGWRIAITRAQEQSHSINSKLTDLGATVINLPTIEIAPPASWEEIDAAIEKLTEYDWLIFTSTNGVDFFFGRFEELKHTSALPVGLKLCAIGPATAERLSKMGVKVDLVPAENRGEGLLKALEETLGRDEISTMKFLFPRAREGRDVLPNGLHILGANVDVVEAYRTVAPKFDKDDLMSALAGKIDIIVFTSPSAVKNLADMLSSNFKEILGNAHVACIGPTTRQEAIRLGLLVSIEPANQKIDDLVEAIILFVKTTKS